MNTLQDLWEKFSESIELENRVSPEALEVMRFSFFNGADALIVIGSNMGPQSEKASEAMLFSLKMECREAFIRYWLSQGSSAEAVYRADRQSYGPRDRPPPNRQ